LASSVSLRLPVQIACKGRAGRGSPASDGSRETVRAGSGLGGEGDVDVDVGGEGEGESDDGEVDPRERVDGLGLEELGLSSSDEEQVRRSGGQGRDRERGDAALPPGYDLLHRGVRVRN